MSLFTKTIYLVILLCFVHNKSQTILLHDNVWNDDLEPDESGINGWSLADQVKGLNTTNTYHGFFDMNDDELNRMFTFPDTGHCNVAFNIVFGCDPLIHYDSVKFVLCNNIGTDHINVFNYSENIPYTFLYDTRIYWGNALLKSNKPQCNMPTDMNNMGGYMMNYNYEYEINDTGQQTFILKFQPNFINETILSKYYAIYNVTLLCKSDAILFKKSSFIEFSIFTRYLLIWVTGGALFFILILYFVCNLINKNTKDEIIDDDGKTDTINFPKVKKINNQTSIYYSPRSAEDVARDMKRIDKGRRFTSFSQHNNIDQNNTTYIPPSKVKKTVKIVNAIEFEIVNDKSNTQTPETTQLDSVNIAKPFMKDRYSNTPNKSDNDSVPIDILDDINIIGMGNGIDLNNDDVHLE